MAELAASSAGRRGASVFSWRGLIALAVAVSLLVFLITSFNPDVGAIRARLAGSNVGLLLLAVAAHYVSLIVRGHRWYLMLRTSERDAEGAVRVPSSLTCSAYLLLGWFVNAVSWLRLGTFYRAHLVSNSGEGFFRALGTVLAERVLDLAAVLLMLSLTGLLLLRSSESGDIAPFLVTAGTAALLLATTLAVMRRYGAALMSRLPRRLSDPYMAFHEAALRSMRPGGLALTVALTLVAWGLEGARLWLVVMALDLSLSLEMLLFVTFAQGLLLSIPLTPGGLGVLEPGLTGLLLLSFERADAVSITVLDRSISYVSVVVIGAVVFGIRELGGLVARRSTAANSAERVHEVRTGHAAES